MPALRSWIPLVLLLIVSLMAAPAALAQDDAELAAEFDRIAAETATLRELPAADIPEAFLSRDELAEIVTNDIMPEEYPPAELAAEQRGLAAFGVIPADADLGQLYRDLYTEQIAGFYDPSADQMYVIGDGDLDAVDEVTYAHEVIHALQDQAFDLEAIAAPFMDGTRRDGELAVAALIEGDATAGMIEYLLSHPLLAARYAAAAVGQPDFPVLDRTPPVLAQPLVFPYLAGQQFVTVLRDEGGWEAVNAAYSDLPATTEQILHPEKYLDRDDPTPVTLPDLASILGSGWSLAAENTWGEYLISLLLAELEPGEGLDLDLPEEAREAAAGWDGDRYAVWANGEQNVVIWQSVWDSEAEAAEFAGALEAFAEGLADGQTVQVEQDGGEVAFVLAPTDELAEAALAALTGV